MSVLTFDSPGSKFRSRCYTVYLLRDKTFYYLHTIDSYIYQFAKPLNTVTHQTGSCDHSACNRVQLCPIPATWFRFGVQVLSGRCILWVSNTIPFGRYQLTVGFPKLFNFHARAALSNGAIYVSPEVTHIGFFSLPLLDQRIPDYPPNYSIASRLS